MHYPHSAGFRESSFAHLDEEEIATHCRIDKYGDFYLTNAVRPAYDVAVQPSEGFRYDFYLDRETSTDIPVIMAAASREKLWELFTDLIQEVGEEVDIVLETSHAFQSGNSRAHRDVYREGIDMPVLQSVLLEHQNLLLNDGCTGIAVLNTEKPMEIQLDEHKLLIVYSNGLDRSADILAAAGIPLRQEMKFITEAEHIHSSSDEYSREFAELCSKIGADQEM